MSGAKIGYAWYMEQSTPDRIDEEHANAEESMREPLHRSKPLLYGRPLRPMQRQHLPAEHENFVSFEERCYRLFRDYVMDIETGKVECSKEEYRKAVMYWNYYQALSMGFVRLMNRETFLFEWVDVTRENRKEILCRISGKKA